MIIRHGSRNGEKPILILNFRPTPWSAMNLLLESAKKLLICSCNFLPRSPGREMAAGVCTNDNMDMVFYCNIKPTSKKSAVHQRLQSMIIDF